MDCDNTKKYWRVICDGVEVVCGDTEEELEQAVAEAKAENSSWMCDDDDVEGDTIEG